METFYERENLGFSAEQGIGRVNDCLFGNWSHNHATSTAKRHLLKSTKWLQT